MWYWDYTPSGNHSKKPLTRKQLAKAREAYEKADMITMHVKSLEAREEQNAEEEIKKLDSLSL